MTVSRLILRWEIDGEVHRDSRMWIPEGENGSRIYEMAHRLVGTLVGIEDVTYLDALTEENNQHDAIQEMMDEAQREAQPDLDAIVESHKTPLRGHWAGENNDG